MKSSSPPPTATEDPGFALCKYLANLRRPPRDLTPPRGRLGYSGGHVQLELGSRPEPIRDSRRIRNYREQLWACASRQERIMSEAMEHPTDLTRIIGETTHRVVSLLIFARESLLPFGKTEYILRQKLVAATRGRLEELMRIAATLVSVKRPHRDDPVAWKGAEIMNRALDPNDLITLYGMKMEDDLTQQLLAVQFPHP